MRSFVYRLTIVIDRAMHEPHLPDHLRYLQQLEADGLLVLFDPFTDRSGGMIVVRAPSLGDARTVAEAGPLVRQGVDTYDLREWSLTGDNPGRIIIES
ncbi:MAG TPA: YciI family protein [Herpetosiphonaceae bacterium]|nr:YciI family protein [Herpetosiphonaceae bacterium]